MNGHQLISNKSYPTTIEHLDDYAFVVAGSETFLGKCGEVEAPWGLLLPGSIKIENAYVVLGNFGPSPDNKMLLRVRILVPIEMLSSSNYKLVVPSSIFPLAQLDAADRRTILGEIEGCEKGRTSLRAARSGIVTAGGVR